MSEGRNAEKDLKAIRNLIGNNVKEFAMRIGMSSQELLEVEGGKKKLTPTQLYRICGVLMNTVSVLISDRVSNKIGGSESIEIKRRMLIQLLTRYIYDYNPANEEARRYSTSKECEARISNPKVSFVSWDEPINPKDNRFIKVKKLNK